MANQTITDRGLEARTTSYGDRVVTRVQANAQPAPGVVHVPQPTALGPTTPALIAAVTLYDPKAWLKGGQRVAVMARLESDLNRVLSRHKLPTQVGGIKCEVRHLARMSTRDERFGTTRLDFPIYLLNAHTSDNTSPDEIRELMLDHGLRDAGQAREQFTQATDGWADKSVEGLGIQPLAGFKKVGFIKADHVARASKDREAGFSNVIKHELGHMCNVKHHVDGAKSVMREGIMLAAGFLDYDAKTERAIVAHLVSMTARSEAQLKSDYERQNP